MARDLTPMSQVQRVMEELGIEPIAAHSPQAKGRIERLWKSLQDRLTKEMRLLGITTLEQANAFLPDFLVSYSKRFGVAPRDEEPAWVSLGDGPDTDRLFSTREFRTVANDHTLSFQGQTCLLLRDRTDTSLAGRKVAVHVTPEGETLFYNGHTRLACQVCQDPVPVPVTEPHAQTAVSDVVRLALEHRRGSFNPHTGRPPVARPTPQAPPALP
jgi:hypothetical protein